MRVEQKSNLNRRDSNLHLKETIELKKGNF